MLKNYLKITLRSLWKSKLFVLINILGMGIAISCCIVAYLNYDFNANFDSAQDHEGLYRVDITRTIRDKERMYGISPAPLGAIVAQNFGEVKTAVRYMPSGGNFKVLDELYEENFTFVDPDFFEVFNFEFIAGTRSTLEEKSSVIISEQLAIKYFGDKAAIGKSLTHMTDNGPKDYVVTGIFKDMPLNSSFSRVKTITHIDNYFDLSENNDRQDWSKWVTLFVKLDDPGRLNVIEQRLTDYIEIQNKARLDFKVERYVLEPFEGMAYRAGNDEVWGHWMTSSIPPPAVFVPTIMAVLILLIACFNFTNTSIAISSRRLKEIGIRKVMGGLRQQLVVQFLLENMLLCFMALIVGTAFAFWLVPAYSEMWPFLELKLDFYQNAGFFLFLMALLLFTGFLAGSYPAFYITGFAPAGILKGIQKIGESGKLAPVLLTLQFTISLIAIVLGVAFHQNAIYQKELDYGFNNEGVISLRVEDEDEYRILKNRVMNEPRILSIAGSEHQLERWYRNDPVKNADQEFDVDIFHVGENFIETLDFTLLEGRSFVKDSETDYKESVLVSEEMVKTFGWDEPIGQKLTWTDTAQFYVIGVVKNAFVNGLWSPLEPMMIRYVPEKDYRFLTVKTAPSDLIAVNDFLKGEWKKLYPDKMYSGEYLDEEMSDAAAVNNNIIDMFTFLGSVATFLSTIGLFSLVSLSIVKRMKEIGVRKVLGASIINIMLILNKRFSLILSLAVVFGSVLSYFMVMWFMDMIWKYHVTPDVATFVISALILIVAAMFTISYKIYSAASMNPVNTLRTE